MSEGPREYDELQLRIERSEGGYRVLALTRDGRTGRGTFVPPVSDSALDEFVARVGLVKRSRDPDVSADIESFGAGLYRALMGDQVAAVMEAAKAAALDHDRGLRVTLVLSGAPELMRLPWEFLYRRPRFLAQSAHTPVVRSLDLPTVRRPRAVVLPLRILGIASAPSGYDTLDAAQERDRLERAMSSLHAEGLVSLEWLPEATLTALADRICEPDDIHVLHFIGHGAYDEATEAGNLVFEDARGRADDVSGRDLGAMLQDEDSLRLVVLNACEGARTSRIDPFSGVATSLVEFDIPAVVGMQFEITDEAAIAFADALYRALAHGLPIDAAMGPARRAIVAAHRRAEFGTPVLFLRGSDARLFDVQERARPGPEDSGTVERVQRRGRASSDPRWADALSALSARRWGDAAEALEQLGEDYPNDEEVQARLAETRRQQDLAARSADAAEAANRGDWERAVSLLEQVLALDPADDDAWARLEQARTQVREEQLAQRYTDAVTQLDRGHWQQAASILEGLEREAPDYRAHDVQSLLTVAQERLRPVPEEPAGVVEPQSGAGGDGGPEPALPRRRAGVVIAVTAALVALVAGIVWLVTGTEPGTGPEPTPGGNDVAVPNVARFPESQAVAELTDAGFDVRSYRVCSGTLAAEEAPVGTTRQVVIPGDTTADEIEVVGLDGVTIAVLPFGTRLEVKAFSGSPCN